MFFAYVRSSTLPPYFHSAKFLANNSFPGLSRCADTFNTYVRWVFWPSGACSKPYHGRYKKDCTWFSMSCHMCENAHTLVLWRQTLRRHRPCVREEKGEEDNYAGVDWCLAGVSLLETFQSCICCVGLVVCCLQATIRSILDCAWLALVVLPRLWFLALVISVNYRCHSKLA